MNNEHKTNPITFIQTLRELKLPPEALARMREELSAYADLHAVPAAAPAVFPAFSFSFMRSRGFLAGALALVLVVATGGEAALASEKALPGDILYSVKVSFAEPVALALASHGESKAELSTVFATRRIEEATALSEIGELTDERAEELASRFEAHLDVADEEAKSIEASGNVSGSLAVRADIEKGITEQIRVLAPEDASAARGTSVMMMGAPAPSESAPMMAKMAVTEPAVEDTIVAEPAEPSVAEEPTPKDRFFARIQVKAQEFTLAREELESALSVQVDSSTEVTGGLEDTDAGSPTFIVDDNLFSTTTVEATSTIEVMKSEAGTEPSAASRFFTPFYKK
ncbi:MAG: hypothetical protein AB199_02570 [Parcubacteria bacterium C7867-004]|nr:MAG: hypothetical protein AB199_02570 [Parcubacteria bacterium C7867-004]